MNVNNSSIFATMTDFSKHGIGFMAQADVNRDEDVIVHFDIPIEDGTFKAFQFHATVRHCMQVSEQHHIGVRLLMENEEYSDLFDRLLVA